MSSRTKLYSSLTSFKTTIRKADNDPYTTGFNNLTTEKKTDLVKATLNKYKQWDKNSIIHVLSNKEGRKLNFNRNMYRPYSSK